MDHNAKARRRIFWQYKNSPKLIAWLLTLPTIAQAQIEDQLAKIKAILDIDNAEGEQLDICGRIAGYSKRPVGTFYPTCAPAAVGDDLFRRMIKSKIYKNNSIATIDAVATAMNYILDTEARILDGQDMTMRPVFYEYLDVGSQKLVADYDLIPRPQGVKLRDARFLTYTPFGFGDYYANFRAPFWHGDGIQYYTNLRISLLFSDGQITGALTANDDITVADVDITLVYTLEDGGTSTDNLVTGSDGTFSATPSVSGNYTAVARAQVWTPLCEWENVESNSITNDITMSIAYASGTVSGAVVASEGITVSGLSVTLTYTSAAGTTAVTVTTDSSGAFTDTVTVEGDYTLVASVVATNELGQSVTVISNTLEFSYEVDYAEAMTLQFNGSAATVSGALSASGITTSGVAVTITYTSED